MNVNKRDLIKNLLDGSRKSASEMTHIVSELGDGSMSKGFGALVRCGIVIGAGTVTAVVSTYHVFKAVAESSRIKRELLYATKHPSCDLSNANYVEEVPLPDAIATTSSDINSEEGDSVITPIT